MISLHTFAPLELHVPSNVRRFSSVHSARRCNRDVFSPHNQLRRSWATVSWRSPGLRATFDRQVGSRTAGPRTLGATRHTYVALRLSLSRSSTNWKLVRKV